MSPNEVEALLERLAPDLDGLGEPWTIIGSGALMILGFPVGECSDVDILTTRSGAAALERLWRHRRQVAYQPPAAPFASQFSRYLWAEGAVEVMGDMRVHRPEGWAVVDPGQAERRRFGRHNWPVPSPHDQLRLLDFLGRPKDLVRASGLRTWLDDGEPATNAVPSRRARPTVVESWPAFV